MNLWLVLRPETVTFNSQSNIKNGLRASTGRMYLHRAALRRNCNVLTHAIVQRIEIEEDRAKAEDAAKLREDDYQLAYAIDILKGLSKLAPTDQ